jgi:hypothetical protein
MPEKVEGYKVDDNMRQFAKSYKKLESVRKMLSERLLAKMQSIKSDQQKLGELTKGIKFMLNNVPQSQQTPEGMERAKQ